MGLQAMAALLHKDGTRWPIVLATLERLVSQPLSSQHLSFVATLWPQVRDRREQGRGARVVTLAAESVGDGGDSR